MPFRKSFRKIVRNKRFRRRKGKVTLKKVDRQVKVIKRTFQPETKFTDWSTSSAGISYNGGVSNITAQVVQGDDFNARTGAQIRLTTLHFKAYFTGFNASTVSPFAIVRMIIFRGRSENTVAYPVNNILQASGAVDAVTSPKTWNQRKNTHILYDKNIVLANGYGITYPPGANLGGWLEGHLKLGWVTTYNSNSVDVQDGGLYMLLISNISVGQGTPTAPSIYFRLNFTDA